jgi:MFS family permease
MEHASHRNTGLTTRYSWYVFGLLFLLYLFDYMDRLVIVSLFPFLKLEWGLSDTQCGLLVSAVSWSILIFSFPGAVLVDRWSRKKSIGLMAVIWSLATLACAFTRSFTHLFLARTAIGVGEAGYAAGGTAMISALFPQERRAKILGLWNASIPLGSALGIVIGGFVAEHYGWRHAFGLVALPGLVVALLFFGIKDYQTVELVRTVIRGKEKERVRMKFRDIAGEFSRNRTLIFNNLGFAANVFVTTAMLTWLPTYFHRMEGLDMARAGVKGGLVMLLAVVGAPLAGYLTDRWLKKRANARMVFPALSSMTTGALLFTAFMFFSGPLQYWLLLAAGVAAVGFVPGAVAVTQDVVHAGLRAISLSVNVIIQHLLGSSLGPVFVGAVSDGYGLDTALVCLPAFAILGGVLFFIGSFFYERDLAKVEQVEVTFQG